MKWLIISIFAMLMAVGAVFAATDGYFSFDNSGYFNKVSDIRNPSGTILNLTGGLKYGGVNVCLADGSININGSQTFGVSAGRSGSTSRPLISETDRNISFCSSGCDYSVWSDLINVIPYYLKHRYIITIGNGNYDIDMIIPPTIISDVISSTEGSIAGLWIQGNTSNRNLVTFNSLQIVSSIGSQNPNIEYLTFDDIDEFSDENVTISIYGSSHPVIRYINITATAEYGIMAYGSDITTTNIDFGSNLQNAYLVKHGANIWDINGESIGTVANNVCKLAGGNCYIRDDNIDYSGLKYESSATTLGYGVERDGANKFSFANINSFLSNLIEITFSSQNGNKAFSILRDSATTERADFYVDDSGLNILSIQDEVTGHEINFISNATNNGVDTFIFTTNNGNIATISGEGNLDIAGDFTSSGFIRAGTFLGVGSPSSATISSGSITVTKSTMSVDTEGASATDDLDTISGGNTGDIIILQSVTNSRDTTLKDATGNLKLNGDFTLVNTDARIMLIKSGSYWIELSRIVPT